MTDLSGAIWHKSSHSGGNGGNCVEVAENLAPFIAVRDSKDPHGGALVFGREQWAAFLDGVRGEEFDR